MTDEAHRVQRRLAWRRMDPEPAEIDDDVDYFGNPVQRFALTAAHARLLVRSVAEVAVSPPPAPLSPLPWDLPVRLARDGDPLLRWELAQYGLASPHVPLLPAATALARQAFAPGRDVVAALLALARRRPIDQRDLGDAIGREFVIEIGKRERHGARLYRSLLPVDSA